MNQTLDLDPNTGKKNAEYFNGILLFAGVKASKAPKQVSVRFAG